jgi:UDP-N-acetylglucosamine 3-dehydrogenase
MTQSKNARLILIGLGRMGQNHLRVLRETPGVELVAVIDPKAKSPAPSDLAGAKFARDLSEVDPESFDAAVIATPTGTHHEVALSLIAKGKDLLIEKPLASTYAQGVEILEAAAKKGCKLAVGHVERFNPAVRKLREIIKEGFLGTPIHFAFTRVGGYPDTLVQGNNVILDLAVHDIDVLRSIVGPLKLERSMCHVTWREGVFDTAEILLGATNGASATVHVNWITPTKIRSIRVTGTRGVCFVDYILQTCELMGGSLLKQVEPSSSDFQALQHHYLTTDKISFGVHKVEPLKMQASQFLAFMRTGETGELCLGRDALAAVLLAERAVQSDNTRIKRASLPPSNAIPTLHDDWV